MKCSLLLWRYLVLGDDDEVHVAVGVGVAAGERSLEIRAAEGVAENILRAGNELDQ